MLFNSLRRIPLPSATLTKFQLERLIKNKENVRCIFDFDAIDLFNFLTIPMGIWTMNRRQWNYSKLKLEFCSKNQIFFKIPVGILLKKAASNAKRNFWKSDSVSWFFLTKFTTSGAVTCFTYHKRWLVFWPIFAASKLPMFLFEQKRQKVLPPSSNAHKTFRKKIHQNNGGKKRRQNNERKSFSKRQKITAHKLRAKNVQQKIPSKQRRKESAVSRVWWFERAFLKMRVKN